MRRVGAGVPRRRRRRRRPRRRSSPTSSPPPSGPVPLTTGTCRARWSCVSVTSRMPRASSPSSVTSTSWPGPGLTVVTGPSGVGKSTLLDLVAGLRRRRGHGRAAPAAHYVTQRPFLATRAPSATNLTLGHDPATAPHRPRTVGAPCEPSRSTESVAALPDGLSTPIGDDGFGLSAGQRQRLALARAWLATETLLLLDEPTAHLDPEGAELDQRLVAELAERRVVIAVTHRDELVSDADQHLHLLPAERRAELPADVPEDESAGPRPRGGGPMTIATTRVRLDAAHDQRRRIALAACSVASRPSPAWPSRRPPGWLIVARRRAARHPDAADRDRRGAGLRHGTASVPLLGAPRQPRRALAHARRRRTSAAYEALIPLTPARLGRRRRVRRAHRGRATTSPTWSTPRCASPSRSSRRAVAGAIAIALTTGSRRMVGLVIALALRGRRLISTVGVPARVPFAGDGSSPRAPR